MVTLLQINFYPLRKSGNLEKKFRISQNLAKILTENCFCFFWFFHGFS